MAVLVALTCVACSDSGTKYQFATYQDAKADKTVIGASLPEFVPASAREIVGWYHVETNRQTTEFSFAPSDRYGMVSSFSPASNSKMICTNDGLHSWSWSDIRKGNRFEFYSKKALGGSIDCLSIDIDRSRAYYWVGATG